MRYIVDIYTKSDGFTPARDYYPADGQKLSYAVRELDVNGTESEVEVWADTTDDVKVCRYDGRGREIVSYITPKEPAK